MMIKLSISAGTAGCWLSLSALALFVAAAAILPTLCHGDMLPNPNPYTVIQPDGTTETCDLYLRGSIEESWEEDADGHTVIQDDAGFEVYAVRDPTSGRLVSSHCVVGLCEPRKVGIGLYAHERRPLRQQEATELLQDVGIGVFAKHRSRGRIHPKLLRTKKEGLHMRKSHRTQGREMKLQDAASSNDRPVVVMKNMVVLMRFSDHMDRRIPTREDIDKLFNTVDCDRSSHSDICPTGSVRDCFLFNSYGKLDMQSEVFGWIDMPETESYYAGGYAGVTGTLQDGIKWALGRVQAQLSAQGRGFRDFDGDGDGWIDALGIIYSGYDASYGGQDCYNPESDRLSRIWAHYWNMGTWTSNDWTKVDDYHISSALWGSCNNEIAHIGVICHETGHFLGFPDLYDGGGGVGLGSWALMSNSWGFDKMQYDPPMMNPWGKMRLGWMEPFYITENGRYEVSASHSDPRVYVIKSGYPDKEYLIIENRQRYPKFEANIPRSGLMVWHIDEAANISIEGHPGMGGWPGNGKHYAISILQADGQYDLERGQNIGDESDVFRAGGTDEIGPEGIFNRKGKLRNPYPNTDAYQYGNIRKTGHSIFDISSSRETMAFSYCKDCKHKTRKKRRKKKRCRKKPCRRLLPSWSERDR